MKVVLLGGTDLTLAAAERLLELDLELAAIVHVGSRFEISYAPGGVENVRSVDLAAWAKANGVPAHEYKNAGTLEELLREDAYDIGLVAGWYHMVPRRVRERFRIDCVGVHASLLPRFRGGAPLNWAILAGEEETGVTLFRLADEIDAGPVYGQRAFPIGPRTTIAELVAAAQMATLELVAEILPRLNELEPSPQTGEPSYGLQRTPEDGRIDWRLPSADIDRLVRAVGSPYPGARSMLDGRDVLVWAAEPLTDAALALGAAGQLLRLPDVEAPCVVTGDGVLEILEATDVKGVPLLDELRRATGRRFSPA